jgi:hypothetical protein
MITKLGSFHFYNKEEKTISVGNLISREESLSWGGLVLVQVYLERYFYNPWTTVVSGERFTAMMALL